MVISFCFPPVHLPFVVGESLNEEKRNIKGTLFFLQYTCNGIVFGNIMEWTVKPSKNHGWILHVYCQVKESSLHTNDPIYTTFWKRQTDLEKDYEVGGSIFHLIHYRWNGWMASPTRWTWVWVSSGSWWWTGKLGGLQSMGSQRIRHNWATELTLQMNIYHCAFV